jgi:hypothetical protein
LKFAQDIPAAKKENYPLPSLAYQMVSFSIYSTGVTKHFVMKRK